MSALLKYYIEKLQYAKSVSWLTEQELDIFSSIAVLKGNSTDVAGNIELSQANRSEGWRK